MNKYKTIPGFDNRYAISKDGEVVSYVNTKPKIMKHITLKSGYIVVNLHKLNNKGKPLVRSVSFLLLSTWKGPRPSPKHKARFIDGNPKNLSLSNLEWATSNNIMSDTLNKIKHTMRRKKRKRIIIVSDGIAATGKLLRSSVQYVIDTGEPTYLGFYAFTEEGYAKWVEKNGKK